MTMISMLILLAAPAAAPPENELAVQVELTIGVDGTVTECTTKASNAPETLTSETCRIFREKARFKPALDSSGNPVASKRQTVVKYRLSDAPAQ